MDIDKKLVQNTELTFIKENLTKTLLLNDDGVVELYEDNKLVESKPFSKITIERDYKKLVQEGYTLQEDVENIKYNVYLLCGEDGVYNSNLVDTVESEEQAQDRVRELEAENSCSAYYMKVVNGKEIEESKKVESIDDELEAKQKSAEKLMNFFNDSGITQDNVQENKDVITDFLNKEDLEIIVGPVPFIIEVGVKNEFGGFDQLGRLIYNKNAGKWGYSVEVFSLEPKTEAEEQIDLDQTEQDLKDDIEQVDRAQELKDELETKLDKLYNESYIVVKDTVEGPLYLVDKSTTFKKEDAKVFNSEQDAKDAIADYTHNVVDYDVLTNPFKLVKLEENVQQVPNTEIKKSKEVEDKVMPTNKLTSKKLTKQEILDMNQIPVSEEQAEFLTIHDINEEDIILGLQDVVKQMKYLQKDKPFISIEEYVNEVINN